MKRHSLNVFFFFFFFFVVFVALSTTCCSNCVSTNGFCVLIRLCVILQKKTFFRERHRNTLRITTNINSTTESNRAKVCVPAPHVAHRRCASGKSRPLARALPFSVLTDFRFCFLKFITNAVDRAVRARCAAIECALLSNFRFRFRFGVFSLLSRYAHTTLSNLHLKNNVITAP
jgi:hypothetical protein